ncbi:MAG: hypothetical protein K2L47_02670, partial [Clostridia bacterium]|nr:hypothetical protein [Clostridia bacterium]
MRESVKNKRKLIVTAIAVIIALLLSVTTGLLIYNPKGSSASEGGVTDGLLGNVADSVDITKSTTGNSGSESISGYTGVGSASALENAINNNINCYLTNSFEVNWGLSNKILNSVIDGRGNTITFTVNDSSWAKIPSINGSGNNNCGGALLAVNQGTVRNIKFSYSDKTWKFAAPSHGYAGKRNTIASFGFVCGENRGTIQNVRLDINNAQVEMHADTYADGGYANKLTFGGICGVQSGTLNNAYVNIQGASMLKIDTKNWKGLNSSYQALQMGILGGVYGAYTSATAAVNTSNLMMVGASTVTLSIANTASGTGSAQKGEFNLLGAVAGYNISGVRGVVWDYQGDFWTNSYLVNNVNYVCDSYQSSKAAAMTGIPNGYYSPSATHACINGSGWLANSNDNAGKIVDGYGSGDMPTNGAVDWGRDTTDAARGKIERDFGKAKIDMAQYDDSQFGAVEMAFTNDPGYLNIKKTMTSYGTYDCFFRVGTCATNAISSGDNLLVSYASTNYRSFDCNFNMASSDRFEIVTGKRLSGSYGLQLLGNQSYTGNDYLT